MTAKTLLRWAGYIGVAVLFAIVCVFLSRWQFDRNESRAAEIDLVETNYDADPVPIFDIIGDDDVLLAADEWLPVILQGHYLSEEQVYVRNRPHGGTSAFEVLVPFLTDEGTVVIVNRGWVSPIDGSTPETAPAPPDGEVEVVVRLRPGEALPSSGRSAPEGQVPTIHLPSVAEGLTNPVLTSAYGELVSEDPAPGSSPSGFSKPTEDPGPHLSYAIQWILFAVMGFTFIGYVIRTEIVHRREDHAADASGGERPRREKRRRDRDAEAEDELVDQL